MPKFIEFNRVRIDVDSVEVYIPTEFMIGDITKFQVNIYRKNVETYLALTFIDEKLRDECLKYLDSVFKPNS